MIGFVIIIFQSTFNILRQVYIQIKFRIHITMFQKKLIQRIIMNIECLINLLRKNKYSCLS